MEQGPGEVKFRSAFSVCHLLGMSSAISNPLIYGYFNQVNVLLVNRLEQNEDSLRKLSKIITCLIKLCDQCKKVWILQYYKITILQYYNITRSYKSVADLNQVVRTPLHTDKIYLVVY